MAIELSDLREILTLLQQRPASHRGKLLILGSAEVHISSETYRSLLNEYGMAVNELPHAITPFFLGDSLGFETTETLDINGDATITHDLMTVVPTDLLEKYDLIVDAGVLFWCFNPGLALENILSMLKLGGDVMHITAVSGFYGRGYYNIHPKVLDDFYALNRCQFLSATFRTRKFKEPIWKRILNRMGVFKGDSKQNQFRKRSEAFGQVFFSDFPHRDYAFLSEAPALVPRFVPNDVIGVFAFRKDQRVSPTSPVLL